MSASFFEGENSEGFIKMNPDLPGNCIPPKTPSSLPNYMPFSQPSNANIPHALEPIKPHLDKDPSKTCLKCIQKPTQHVKDIFEGIAESSKLPPGVQLSTQPQGNEDIPVEELKTVFEGEGLSDWIMVVDEYALAAEISEAKALKPRNLAKVKAWPDWPLWEKAIQISVLKATGTWELIDTPKGVNIVGSKIGFPYQEKCSWHCCSLQSMPGSPGIFASAWR
jgi:hypothetical protein